MWPRNVGGHIYIAFKISLAVKYASLKMLLDIKLAGDILLYHSFPLHYRKLGNFSVNIIGVFIVHGV